MPDTGWLKPAFTTPTSLDANGVVWHFTSNMGVENNYGALSQNSLDYLSPGWPSDDGRSSSESIIWDWVVPSALSIPSVAVVVGIEMVLYGFTNQWSHPFTMGVTSLKVGDAVIYAGRPELAKLFHVVENEDDQPGGINGPSLDTLSWPVTFGSPTELGGLPAGTRVSDFFNQKAETYGFVSRHAGMIHSSFLEDGETVEPPYNWTHSVRFTFAEMKIHYETPGYYTDLESNPEVIVSKTSDIEVIKRLESIVAFDVLVEQAALGGDIDLESNPVVNAGMPADITNGLLFVDSTAYPVVAFTIPDPYIAIIRHSDISAEPEIAFDITVGTPGNRIDMESGPTISVDVDHGVVGVVVVLSDPQLEISMNDPGLVADNMLASEPFVYIGVTANLQGDINIASWCGVAEIEVVLSLDADLGYVRGLYSDPYIGVTVEDIGLVVTHALEFGPLVSLSIPFANLESMFQVPAPDHRTIFKCPVDRTIRITRKDKTIL